MKKRSVFTGKLVYAYTAVFTVLMVLFMTVAYYYIVRTSRELAILNQNEFANKALAQVESYLTELDDVSYRIMTNSRLLNIFSHLQEDTVEGNYFDSNILMNIDVGSLLGTINGPQSRVWRIGVYNQHGDYIRSGAIENKERRNNILASSNVEKTMVELRDLPNKMVIYPAAVDRWSDIYSSQYVTVKRPLMNIYSQEVYGIVEIQQDVQRLQTLMQFGTPVGLDMSICAANGVELLRVGSGESVSDKSAYSVTQQSEKYGWKVTLSQSQEAMIAPYQPLIRLVLVGGVLLILLVATVIAMIARRLSRPLVSLKDTVANISYANSLPSELIAGSDSIDEVRELGLAFNNMLARISDSVALEKKAMMLALQSQMNPHFLYNVITVISAACMEGREEQAVHMCDDLCAMLRYVSSFEDTIVTVREEVGNVTTYLELMKARYEDYFCYELDVSPEVLDLPIPKLVLQPLAENCFEHAFSGMEPPYFIRISAGMEPWGWYIRVSDNGGGMTAPEKAQVLEKIERYSKNLSVNYREMKLGGLGLINTALRLRFNSIHPIALSIEDNPPRGTTVVMKEGET